MKKFKNIIANIKDIIIRMILPYLKKKLNLSLFIDISSGNIVKMLNILHLEPVQILMQL